MISRQPRELDDAPRDTWLLASAVLTAQAVQDGQVEPVVVPFDGKRYPHICKITVPAGMTMTKAQDIETWMRDCGHPACVRAFAEYTKRRSG